MAQRRGGSAVPRHFSPAARNLAVPRHFSPAARNQDCAPPPPPHAVRIRCTDAPAKQHAACALLRSVCGQSTKIYRVTLDDNVFKKLKHATAEEDEVSFKKGKGQEGQHFLCLGTEQFELEMLPNMEDEDCLQITPADRVAQVLGTVCGRLAQKGTLLTQLSAISKSTMQEYIISSDEYVGLQLSSTCDGQLYWGQVCSITIHICVLLCYARSGSDLTSCSPARTAPLNAPSCMPLQAHPMLALRNVPGDGVASTHLAPIDRVVGALQRWQHRRHERAAAHQMPR